MNFVEAKHLLYSGIPIVHSEYGRLFPLGNKESMFAKVTSNKFTKFHFKRIIIKHKNAAPKKVGATMKLSDPGCLVPIKAAVFSEFGLKIPKKKKKTGRA